MSSLVQDGPFSRVLLILFYSFCFWIFQNGATSRHFVSQIKTAANVHSYWLEVHSSEDELLYAFR